MDRIFTLGKFFSFDFILNGPMLFRNLTIRKTFLDFAITITCNGCEIRMEDCEINVFPNDPNKRAIVNFAYPKFFYFLNHRSSIHCTHSKKKLINKLTSTDLIEAISSHHISHIFDLEIFEDLVLKIISSCFLLKSPNKNEDFLTHMRCQRSLTKFFPIFSLKIHPKM